MPLTRGLVLSVANQVGGAMPSTSVVKDYSRFGNNSSAVVGVSWLQIPTGLWVMSVTSGVVSFPPSISFNALDSYKGSLTIAIWINGGSQSVTGVSRIFHKEGDSSYPFTLRVSTATPTTPYVRNYDGTNNTQVSSLINGLSNKWKLITVTFTPSIVSMFTNGLLSNTAVNAVAATTKNNSPVYLFNVQNPGGDRPFVGMAAKARIYTYAFTAAQIRTMFNQERRLFGV